MIYTDTEEHFNHCLDRLKAIYFMTNTMGETHNGDNKKYEREALDYIATDLFLTIEGFESILNKKLKETK